MPGVGLGAKARRWERSRRRRNGWVRLLSVLALAALARQVPAQAAAEQGPPPLVLDLNLPAYRLEVRAAGAAPWTIPVAVGMPGYPTPRGDFELSAVEWNPWWFPPDSPWAAKEKDAPPGPANPMGRVKLHFRPLYFLHGTPWPGSIGTAGSHGCVRLRNDDAIRLGRAVVRAGAPEVTDAQLDAMIADSTHTHMIALSGRVPLVVRYELVEVHAGRLLVHRDIYHLKPPPGVSQVLDVLAAAGWDTSVVDTSRVRALLRRGRTRGGSVGPDSLDGRGTAAPGGGRARLDGTINDCIIVQ